MLRLTLSSLPTCVKHPSQESSPCPSPQHGEMSLQGNKAAARPPTDCTPSSWPCGHSALARSPLSLRIYRRNALSNKQGSLGTPPSPRYLLWGGHLWAVAQLVRWPSAREADDLRQSVLGNKIFRTPVPGFPLDCSSSTSSSNRPQPAVSISNRGIVVSSVEVTPGRSLHKEFGKGSVNNAETMPKG